MGGLSGLFSSEWIAVVGATDREGSVGRAVMRNLTSGFDGTVLPVNPRRETVFERPALDSVADADADLAVTVVPPDVVESVVREAGQAGVRNVVVITAGFGETGSKGATREATLVELAAGSDLMLVEGGGDWATGGIVDLTGVDVADRLDAVVLLVATYETAADLDGVIAAAESFGDRLAGIVFNNVPDAAFDDLEREAVPFVEDRRVDVLGVLPHDRDLGGVRVADLAAELGTETIVEGDTDAYVERFLVGAVGGDAALRYFRRTKDAAVVTGGDRPEVITAALEAPGVNAIILTGSHRPPAAVLGTAERRGVLVVSAAGDTLSSVDRAEAIVEDGRTREEGVTDRMRTLLHDHADIDTLLEADGNAGAAADEE